MYNDHLTVVHRDTSSGWHLNEFKCINSLSYANNVVIQALTLKAPQGVIEVYETHAARQ